MHAESSWRDLLHQAMEIGIALVGFLVSSQSRGIIIRTSRTSCVRACGYAVETRGGGGGGGVGWHQYL